MFTATVHSELARDWRDAMRIVSDGLAKAVDEGCKAGAAEARERHRYKDRTGALTKSISGQLLNATLGAAMGEMVAAAPYASFVEEGTPPHDIWPKAGEKTMGPLRRGQSRRDKTDIGTHRVALRWESGGEYHFARMVHHPGGKPHPFMGPAYQKCERTMYAVLDVNIAKAQTALDR
jgi:hypothetical protein